MTAYQKSLILNIMIRKINLDPPFKLNQLTPILIENGFTREIYGGMNAKRWVQANFPEIAMTGNVGFEILELTDSNPAPSPVTPTAPLPQR